MLVGWSDADPRQILAWQSVVGHYSSADAKVWRHSQRKSTFRGELAYPSALRPRFGILTSLLHLFQFAIDNVHSRMEKSGYEKDILGRHLQIHQSNPERLSQREIMGAMSINV